MRATDGGPDRKAWTIAAAIVSACAWFGVPGDTAMAQAKISDEEAKEIAVKAVPGEVTDFAIEKKLGANRYVVEVIAADRGAEIDVIIDMETGKVLATDD